MRVVAYIRVSRVGQRQGPSFISPSEQRRVIEASRHEIVEWIEDLDQAGSRKERPGLNRAMGLVEGGEVEGIVVAKLNRFGRSVANQGQLLERLRAANGTLLAVGEGIDTRTETGRLIANIIGAIAEWELDRIRENWASARSAAEARGVHLSEPAPGFEKGPDGQLVKIPERLALIADAFKRRMGADSWALIARWLDEVGLPTRRGGVWTVGAVRNMIANRIYVEQGVVSPAIFEAANAARGVAPARSGRASGLLSGILRCAGCRYAMKLSQSKSRHGKPFTEYRCKSARGETAGGRCVAPTAVKSGVIEPFVMDAFWGFVGDYRMRGVGADALVEEAEAEVVRAEAELDAALDRRLAEALGGDDAPAYIEAVRRRRGAVDEARASLAAATQRAQAEVLGDLRLRELWPDLSLYERRKLLHAAFDCVFVRRTPSGGGFAEIADRAFICTHGDGPDLPRRGVRWRPRPFDFPQPKQSN